jgi:hypothetical protein
VTDLAVLKFVAFGIVCNGVVDHGRINRCDVCLLMLGLDSGLSCLMVVFVVSQ